MPLTPDVTFGRSGLRVSPLCWLFIRRPEVIGHSAMHAGATVNGEPSQSCPTGVTQEPSGTDTATASRSIRLLEDLSDASPANAVGRADSGYSPGMPVRLIAVFIPAPPRGPGVRAAGTGAAPALAEGMACPAGPVCWSASKSTSARS